MFHRASVSAWHQSGVHRADPVVKGGEGVISYQQDRVHFPLFTCNYNEKTNVIITLIHHLNKYLYSLVLYYSPCITYINILHTANKMASCCFFENCVKT